VVAFLFSALSLRQPITGYLETVIPAKAGTHAERIDTQLGAPLFKWRMGPGFRRDDVLTPVV
jgi:hypothetical protein